MSSPEEKDRKRRRIRSHIARDLGTVKYRKRVVKDKKKEVDVKALSHADLVKLINEKEDDTNTG